MAQRKTISKNEKSGNIEVCVPGDKTPYLILPGRLMSDLRAIGFLDGVKSNSDEWLLGEVSYNGEPRKAEGVCDNCGGTGGFLAPTGEKKPGRVAFRGDGQESLFKRKLFHYPCPICMDTNQSALKALERVWLDDPEQVVKLARDIWWAYPGREDMGNAVQEAIKRYCVGETSGTLTLVGRMGCGKSVLAAEIVRACTLAHVPAVYVTAERFTKAVHDSIGREDGSSPELERIMQTPVVVFDQIDWIREYGSGGQTTFTAQRARDIFHHRYAHQRSRATVYVVNTDAWENTNKGEVLMALYDRMMEGEVAYCDNVGMRQSIRQVQQEALPAMTDEDEALPAITDEEG